MPRTVTSIWYYGPDGHCPGGYEFCDDDADQLCAEIRRRGELADAVGQWGHAPDGRGAAGMKRRSHNIRSAKTAMIATKPAEFKVKVEIYLEIVIQPNTLYTCLNMPNQLSL